MSGKYQGLPGQILYIEENIALKKKSGKDSSFGEELVKEYRRYLPGGDKHRLWLQHSPPPDKRLPRKPSG